MGIIFFSLPHHCHQTKLFVNTSAGNQTKRNMTSLFSLLARHRGAHSPVCHAWLRHQELGNFREYLKQGVQRVSWDGILHQGKNSLMAEG